MVAGRTERRVIVFRGRVQGVGFRATARSVARRHPVTGRVRNEPDGSVRLEVQGPPEAVESMLRDLRGLMGRNIASEHSDPAPPRPNEEGFEIKR